MKRLRFAAILALVAIAISIPMPAAAVCVSGVPLCQTFWGYEDVFEGTVVGIDQRAASDADSPFTEMPERFRPPFKIVVFEVQRAWRGNRGPRISLIIPGGPGVWVEDSVDFAMNGRYLAFANRVSAEKNYLTTSSCAPGTHVGSMDASEALAFLETIAGPSSGGRVFGAVYDESTRVPGQPMQPSVEARLILRGEGVDRAQKATKGTFSFVNVKPGTYTLTIEVPAGFKEWDPVGVTIDDSHACVNRSFYLHRSQP